MMNNVLCTRLSLLQPWLLTLCTSNDAQIILCCAYFNKMLYRNDFWIIESKVAKPFCTSHLTLLDQVQKPVAKATMTTPYCTCNATKPFLCGVLHVYMWFIMLFICQISEDLIWYGYYSINKVCSVMTSKHTLVHFSFKGKLNVFLQCHYHYRCYCYCYCWVMHALHVTHNDYYCYCVCILIYGAQ